MNRTAAWGAVWRAVRPGDAHTAARARAWVTDEASLTAKLITHGAGAFRVQRLHQASAPCLPDEADLIGLPARSRSRVAEREVVLWCRNSPVVFAHTVVPLWCNASHWPLFSGLGERSLGSMLFTDPLVRPGALQFARLPRAHALVRRAVASTGIDLPAQVYARRRVFARKGGVLLVTELFLPGLFASVRDKEPS